MKHKPFLRTYHKVLSTQLTALFCYRAIPYVRESKFDDEDMIIGFGRKTISYTSCKMLYSKEYHPNHFWIEGVKTTQSHRRQHFAYRMMRLIVAISDFTGISIQLDTGRKNLAARTLYEKVGFTLMHEELNEHVVRYIYNPQEK